MQPSRSSSTQQRAAWVPPPPPPQQQQQRQQRLQEQQRHQHQQSPPPLPASPPVLPAVHQQLRRRLPSLLTAAWALCSGAGVGSISSSGGGLFLPPLAPAGAVVAYSTPGTPGSSGGSNPIPQQQAAAGPPGAVLLLAGVTANSPAKPAVLLLPIAKIEASIDEIGALLKDDTGGAWQQALDTLSAAPFTKAEFKKTFNAYSDTIYRATSFNGYTSNPPSSQQSIQYLYRNEVLTNLEELREELTYLIAERAKGPEGDWQDRSGLRDYWGRAKAAMDKYMGLAPPEDVEGVRQAVAAQRRQQQQQRPAQ